MKPITTIHSVETWLPQTQPWLFTQVRHLPADVESHVVCETTTNLDQFAVPRIHSLDEVAAPRRALDRALRFTGVRRHLSFLREQVENIRPDVLHSHFGHVGWLNLGALAGTPTRHVVTFYGQDLSRLPRSEPRWRDRYLELFEAADLFLCEGPHMASELEALGCPAARIAVHRLGVDVERIEYRPRRWSPGEPLRVLIAASFREKKGIPYAIQALGRLGPDVPLEVTVIGDANRQPGSAEEKAKILDAVRAHGLEPVVRFLGFQPHDVLVAEAYRHHVFLSPSVTAADGDTEGGAPVSLIDMAASGMPVVSTRHCDIPEVVIDGVNAALAEERDVDGLVAALRSLLDAHAGWADRLQRGRAHIESRFEARAQGRALQDRYASVVTGSDPSVGRDPDE